MTKAHYDIQAIIRDNRRISPSRKEKVINILRTNDISCSGDLYSHPIPTKGLTPNEIRVLLYIKEDLKNITEFKKKASDELYKALGMFASKHEQTRIFNILKANEINNIRTLMAASYKKLEDIPGIGAKSIEVLRKVRTYRHFFNLHDSAN